jgi:radical SAM protein with 4Fe4S-binding SPASM domain
VDFLYKSKVFAGMLLKRAFVGPYLVAIQGNYSCNYSCIFCEWFSPMIKDLRNEIRNPNCYINMDVYKGLVRELSILGTKLILIGDLEPFMDPQLIEKIKYAKDYNLGVIIITNGSLLNKENAEQLVNLKTDYLNVSLNAGTPEIYPRIHVTETKKTFERITSTISFIEKLKEKNQTEFPHTRLSMVVCNRNYQDIVNFVKLCHETGVKNAHIKRLISPSKEIAEELELTPAQEKELKEYLVEALDFGKKHGVTVDLECEDWLCSRKTQFRLNDVPCYYGWLFSMVDADGSVYPCCFQNRSPSCTIGNIKNDSFTELWFSKKYQDFRKNCKNADNRKRRGYQCNNPSCVFNNEQIHKILEAPYLLPFRPITT